MSAKEEISQPVEITEIEEDEEEEEEEDEDSRTLDSADIQSIDSEKQMPNPIDMGDTEDDDDILRKRRNNKINNSNHAPAPSRSPPPSHRYLHTADGRHIRVAIKRGSPHNNTDSNHMIITNDANGNPIQKIMLKNHGAQPVLVTSAQMSQLLAQQTQTGGGNNGAPTSISLQQVEGAQALIALQQQHSIQQSIKTSNSTTSKRAKYEISLNPPFSTQNSQLTDRSNSPQLNIPEATTTKNSQQNNSQMSDFSAPTYIDKQQKSGEISSFIHKINKMIELAEKDEQYWSTDKKYPLIHWNEDGRHFIIHEPDVFTRKLIPTHFRHQKLPSFIRQLNQYGFKKLNRMEHDNFMKYKSEYFEYYHEFFNRDRPEDWHKVKRRRNENSNLNNGNIDSQSLNNLSEKKISEAYLAGIQEGRVKANQQVNATPTIIKQISVQDSEDFQNLQHAFNQLKNEQEFMASQMVAIKNQNSLLMNDNHALKKENKSLKLQINNLWREVSEMKDMFLQQKVDKSNNNNNDGKNKSGSRLADDLQNGNIDSPVKVEVYDNNNKKQTNGDVVQNNLQIVEE